MGGRRTQSLAVAGQGAGRESQLGFSQKGVWHLPDIFQGPIECSVAWVFRCSELEEEPCGLKMADLEKPGTV